VCVIEQSAKNTTSFMELSTLGWPNPSPIHRNIRVARVNDLIRVVTLRATVMASSSLT
jgi:hypothetical protein